VQDFSEDLTPKEFKVNDDEFRAVAQLPSDYAFDITRQLREAGTDTDAQKVVWHSFFDVVLLEGKDVFIARLSDFRRPITFDQQMKIFNWLMGEYGMRPTRSSDGSSSGSDDPVPGTSSTEDAPSKELTLVGSPSTDSSMSPTS
jgi:hypothetical protein